MPTTTKPDAAASLRAIGSWAKRHKILATIAVLLLIGVFGNLLPDPPVNQERAGHSPTEVPAPRAESSATSKPSTPAPAPDQVAEFEDDLRDALGDSNREDVERLSVFDYDKRTKVLSVQFAINDNLSEGMIKDGAKMAVTDILEAVQESDLKIKDVNIDATFSMVDDLGNASEDTVVRATYPSNLVDRINFENFDFEDVYDITDNIFVHPALQD
ncbi:hypothetical protein K8W59_17525 [Nocardioides rotundus]|uniref:hypothetical protein n=1 Tax=Nocardioides rotundus TaxID=1774216 RepID=UPI001CBF25BE|nr:hypothetical protein [Nocardioides rotundus]UAL29528.1 hypothetical protein K8W59_17525 [Nocardioides rotundus]